MTERQTAAHSGSTPEGESMQGIQEDVPAQGPGAARREEVAHTPVPWRAYQGPQSEKWLIAQGHGMGYILASLLRESSEEIQKANAEFIVRAVNCHDELVRALRFLVCSCLPLHGTEAHATVAPDITFLRGAQAALAKARP